jgi:hypothetical protein
MKASSFLRTLALLPILPLVVGAQQDCRRPAPRQFRPGDTVVISQPARMPCRIAIVDTPVELRADEGGVVADIGMNLLRLVDGRFVAMTGRGEVSAWSADGKYLKRLGGPGQGPGEFAAGGMSFHEGPGGTVYIRDNNRRWSVFSPALEFVRHYAATGMGFNPERSTFLADGRFLSASPPSGAAAHFAIYDFTRRGDPVPANARGRAGAVAGDGPALVASFAEVREHERSAIYRGRAIAYAGDSSFWAGPLPETGAGYVLELWSLTGQKQRTIRRTAPWFIEGSDIAPPRQPEGFGYGSQPTTQVTSMHLDDNGLLYVFVAASTGRWKPTPRADTAAFRANEDGAYVMYMEVIDVRAGAVLADLGPLTRAQTMAQLPMQMFRRSRQGFRVGETQDGLPFRRIVDIRLVSQ